MSISKKFKKETRKKRFNILLTNSEMDFLKKISQLENKSIAEILRNAVDFLYNRNSQERKIDILNHIKNKFYLDIEEVQLLKNYENYLNRR